MTELAKHTIGFTGPRPPVQWDERPPAWRGEHTIPILAAPESNDEVVRLVNADVDVVESPSLVLVINDTKLLMPHI